MSEKKKRKEEIFNIAPCLIKPNPALARTEFPDTSLVSLADSIRRYGILQPLAVRLSEKGRYELIAGERRLRAAILLSLPTVPCVIIGECGKYEFLSVVENIQREKLGMFDEARAVRRLFERNGRDAAETAKLLSVSERDVRRKLRLCEFSRAEMQALTRLGISEENAVMYLEVPQNLRYYTIKLCAEKGYQRADIDKICKALAEKNDMTPDDLETFSEALVAKHDRAKEDKTSQEVPSERPKPRPTVLLRDLSLFEASLRKNCDILENAGWVTDIASERLGGSTVYTIKVNKA